MPAGLLNELHVKTDAEPALRQAAAKQMRPSTTDHASMDSGIDVNEVDSDDEAGQKHE